MKINRIPFTYDFMPSEYQLLEDGYVITYEGSGGPFDPIDDPEDTRWYCNLYYGDSNGPHKAGTKLGIGRGDTKEQAFMEAIKNLEVVIGFTKDAT